jgi:hypothetical protein
MTTRRSRVFTISFPAPLAKQVEQTARKENRTISELFRESWRAYRLHAIDKEVEAMRRKSPPTSYTADDVEALVHDVRRKLHRSSKA